MALIPSVSQFAVAIENELDSLRELSIITVATDGRVLARKNNGQVEIILVGVPIQVDLQDPCIATVAQKTTGGVQGFNLFNRIEIFGAFNPKRENCSGDIVMPTAYILTLTFTKRWSNQIDTQMIKVTMANEVLTYYVHVDYIQNQVWVTKA